MDVGLKLEVLYIKGVYNTLVGDGDHKCGFLMKMREWVGWDNTGPRADDVPWHYESHFVPEGKQGGADSGEAREPQGSL